MPLLYAVSRIAEWIRPCAPDPGLLARLASSTAVRSNASGVPRGGRNCRRCGVVHGRTPSSGDRRPVAGVTAGIDMALALIAEVFARARQPSRSALRVRSSAAIRLASARGTSEPAVVEAVLRNLARTRSLGLRRMQSRALHRSGLDFKST